MEQFDEALRFLAEALNRRDSYHEEILEDPALQPLVNDEVVKELSNLMNGFRCGC